MKSRQRRWLYESIPAGRCPKALQRNKEIERVLYFLRGKVNVKEETEYVEFMKVKSANRYVEDLSKKQEIY